MKSRAKKEPAAPFASATFCWRIKQHMGLLFMGHSAYRVRERQTVGIRPWGRVNPYPHGHNWFPSLQAAPVVISEYQTIRAEGNLNPERTVKSDSGMEFSVYWSLPWPGLSVIISLMTYATVFYVIFVERSKVATWGNGVSVHPEIVPERQTKRPRIIFVGWSKELALGLVFSEAWIIL